MPLELPDRLKILGNSKDYYGVVLATVNGNGPRLSPPLQIPDLIDWIEDNFRDLETYSRNPYCDKADKIRRRLLETLPDQGE